MCPIKNKSIRKCLTTLTTSRGLKAALFFLGKNMNKTMLIMLGIGVMFALIVILLAAINEYLRGHDG